MSFRRLLRKIRLRLRRPPERAADILRDYREYLRLQREVHASHEADVPRWAEGQRRFVMRAFRDAPRDARVLDCACGDGVGLEALREMGFLRVLGIDLSRAKLTRARAAGFTVIEGDMHDLGFLADSSFGAVLCSHSLEHAFDPGRVLAHFRRLLEPEGTLHLALPFPDPGARNERAHPAKYEIGTHLADGGESAARFVASRGFEVLSRSLDGFREDEVWIAAARTRDS